MGLEGWPAGVRQLRAQGLVRFDFLDGTLPGRANPTDIDQALERNGHFLFIECKRPHQLVTTGQRIFFDNLVAGPRSVTVVNVVGNPPDEIQGFGRWGKPIQTVTTGEARAYVRAWYDWASRQPKQAA